MGFEIILGDITKVHCDAIVNAANTTLLGGGGVDGAIHAAAGPRLLAECKTLGGCKTGEAKITKGYNLPAKFVIHTPGPIYKDGNHSESELLENSYRNSLELAEKKGCKTVAFPSISTGVYHFPLDKAAAIAVKTILGFLENSGVVETVYMVAFDRVSEIAYIEAFKSFKTKK